MNPETWSTEPFDANAILSVPEAAEPDEGSSPEAGDSTIRFRSLGESSRAPFPMDDFVAFINEAELQHFAPEEFLVMGSSHHNPGSACHGKNTLPPKELWPNIIPTARVLDELRKRLGIAIRPTSVYRSPAYNACLDGTASKSFHMKFQAVDFQCASGDPKAWAKELFKLRAEGLFSGGIGVYKTFVHVDTRGYNAQWAGPGQTLDGVQHSPQLESTRSTALADTAWTPVPDISRRPPEAILDARAAVAAPATASFLPTGSKFLRFSLKEVHVIKNGALIGPAEIYVTTVCVDDISAEPILVDVQPFEGIRDKQNLPIGPGGISMYRNPEAGKFPRFIDYRILVADSDQGLRDVGQLIREIREDAGYQSARNKLVTAVAAANATTALVMEVADVVMGIVGRILMMQKDDQLIYVAGSYDDVFDGLGSKFGLVTNETARARISYQTEIV